MPSLKRATVGPRLAAVALLTGCSLGSAAGSERPGEAEPPPEDENPTAFATVPVSVRNRTGFEALVVSRHERLGTVGAMKEKAFQARLGLNRDLLFEITLRGGGTCSSQQAPGISVLQSIDLIILPGMVLRPGEPQSCVCRMTVM